MSKFNPRVSIVIPVYNGSNYLREAIDSALAQTYKNIEIIVVNDGSIDNGATEKIAKSYGSKIRYFNKKNGGVASALNYGIKKMTGDYFSWLSHDDLLYPNKIESQLDYMVNHHADNFVLYSDYALLQGRIIEPVVLHHEMLERKPRYSLLRGAVNGITVFIPKKIIDEVGLFDTRLKCTQDYDYWLRIQEKFKFVHMKQVLSITRIHKNQDSHTSPNVISEGNELWIRMINNLSLKNKLNYESTEYNFYYEMIKFLKSTPYNEAIEYCDEKLRTIKHRTNFKNNEHMVSVIIPFFNRVNDTINAIKSVQSQTYSNIEIILVNDASTDSLTKLINYIKKYKNIILINSETNKGAAAARNLGIKSASGEFIAFLDSDDEFMSDKLSSQISEMQMYNMDFSYTSYIKRTNKLDEVIGVSDFYGIVVPKIISSCPIATPTVIIRKKNILDNNIYFNENMRIGEDTCYWLELAKTFSFHYVDTPLTIVNVNDKSSAYDYDKATVGLKNILTYLLSDEYYSNYANEISLLANDFFSLTKKKAQLDKNRLDYGKYKTTGLTIKYMLILKNSLLYRVLTKIHRDGLMSAISLAVKKVF